MVRNETECFLEESLKNFFQIVTALWTNKKSFEQDIFNSILNANEDENE